MLKRNEKMSTGYCIINLVSNRVTEKARTDVEGLYWLDSAQFIEVYSNVESV